MPRLQVVSVVDAIADDLRARILRGELEPGTALTEADIASTYEVARPTGKAATEQLVRDGLLVRGNHRSARVVELGPDDVRDIYRTRAHLEREVLRRLARERTDVPAARAANAEIAALVDGSTLDVVAPDMRFHTALVDALGSPRTTRMYRSLVTEVTLCMARVQGRGLLDNASIAREHALILDLVTAGDGDGAAALLDEHVGRARERLVRALGGTPGPEADLPPR
ncbi:GntR family transcriptional regulator [Nocardioides sp. C4-1]|uniref:GntR family transcriptional regulator n=1 Tax=Nocardioides sp. C4-1 TaxID=3151851 RepID=UPI00326663A7